MLQNHKLIIVLLNVDFLLSISSFLILVLASPYSVCPTTTSTAWCVALKASLQYINIFFFYFISILHTQIHMRTHKVKVRPVNIQRTHILRSAHTSTYSVHALSQYSPALATDVWQFMLYSMNPEFSEKVLRAIKNHWLTKQHTKKKWEERKHILNFKFKLNRASKNKPNQGTWLAVYYASTQCAKLLTVGQWGFIACRLRRQLKGKCDWRDAVRSSSGLLKVKSAIYWRSRGALLLSLNKRAAAPSQCMQCNTFTPSSSATERNSVPPRWRTYSFGFKAGS